MTPDILLTKIISNKVIHIIFAVFLNIYFKA